MGAAIDGGLVRFGVPFRIGGTIGCVASSPLANVGIVSTYASGVGVAYAISEGVNCWMDNLREQKILNEIKEGLLRHDTTEETELGIVHHLLSRATISRWWDQLETIIKNNDKKPSSRSQNIIILTRTYRFQLQRLLQTSFHTKQIYNNNANKRCFL